MNKKISFLHLINYFCFVCVCCASQITLAHHSVSGQFNVDKVVKWTGKITQVDWINPHVYLHLAVTSDDGRVTHWQLESHPPAMLRKAKISKSMLRGEEGETVVVEGLPGRDDSKHIGYIYKITYEDGHFYQLVNQ